MKIDPIANLSEELRDSQRGKDFFAKLRNCVEEDDNNRSGWYQKLDHFRRRRYCQEFRDPTYPWEGSSSIVLPLIDKKIDELKPQYVNLVSAARPPVTALATSKEAQKKSHNVEMLFEWLIKFGSPNFIEQVVIAADDLLEKGFGILKSVWHYNVRPAPNVLRSSILPERLRKLIVTKKANADALYALTGKSLAILEPGDFDQLRKPISTAISEEFDLDPDEPMDRIAINEIVSWLRSGAQGDLRYNHKDVVLNVPGIIAVDPKNLIVPDNAPADVEGCERLTNVMWFNEVELRQKAESGEWDSEAVRELVRKRGEAKASGGRRVSIEEYDSSLREGVAGFEGSMYQVYETCCWFSSGEGKPDFKAVVTWSEASDVPLKSIKYMRPSGKWPYHRAEFERNKNRWHSPRGVPEKLDDLDYELTQQHRYKLNRATITTAPTIIFEPTAGIDPSTWRWIPGQMMPARNAQTGVRVLDFPQLDIVFDNEQNILRTWAEEYLGGTDFGVTNPLSQTSEPRTATEINSIGDRARQSLSLRGLLFQRMMQDVYREMFDLWHVYGNDEVWIRVTGSPDPIRLTKEELQGEYVFQPTGTIGEQDPRLETQKALMRIDMLTKLKPMLEPKYEVDLGVAVMDWLQKDDPRAANLIVRERSEQEVKLIMQQMEQERQRQFAEQQALASQNQQMPTYNSPGASKTGNPQDVLVAPPGSNPAASMNEVPVEGGAR